ncbi:MAG: ROK family transcriptional regulator [Faecalibacterium sp.]|jgi:predicted NBD/HSP70 family sugar kinase|nr:ROK family transcriptional regulator [Faecalibacterium sp.]
MNQLNEAITERRRLTRNTIYQHLYEAAEPCTKQEIAQALSLSLPTVHQNLTELLQAGLVCYSGAQRSTGGRRAMGYMVEPGAKFAIGISITGDRIRILAADLRLETIAYKKTRRMSSEQAHDIGDFISRELERFLDENNLDRGRMLGVGMAAPAVIDAQHKNIILAPTLRLRDLSLGSIEKKVPYPSFIDNDGTCGGHTEWFMRGEKDNMAYLSLEDGVGGAVLVQGAPYLGANRRSGEFGHICVEPNGLPCKCGKRGCLEAYCSALRLSEEQGISLETFFSRLRHGDPACAALWEDFLQHLAIGINTIRMTLDCNVVLGGFLSQYLAPWLPQLREKAAALNTFEENADYIRMARDPRYAVVRGAALHFIKEYLGSL